MKKCQELADPNSRLNKARDDELIFVLLERDRMAADVVRFWADCRVNTGKNRPGDPEIREALAWADAVDRIHQ